MMNDIQQLQVGLTKKFPDLETVLSPPLRDDGVWQLDLRLHDRQWVVQWPFSYMAWGLSALTALTGYGEGPDESYPDLAGITVRLLAILSQKRIPINHETVFTRLGEKRFRTYRDNWKRIEAYSEEADHAAAHILVLAGPAHFYIHPYRGMSSDETLKALIDMFDDAPNVTVGEAVSLIEDGNNYRQVLGFLNRQNQGDSV